MVSSGTLKKVRNIIFSIPSIINIFLTTYVLQYCEHLRQEPRHDMQLTSPAGKSVGQEFVAVDPETLFDIIVTANNLDMRPLGSVLMIIRFDIPDDSNCDIGYQTVLTMTESKTSEEVRKLFML